LRYKFLFSIFVFFFISVFIALGSWQIIRLNLKLELINQIETSLKDNPINLTSSTEKNYLKIKTNGSIDFEKQIYLYNLDDKGKPGFEVVNPLKIRNKNYLLNRGWIPFDKKNNKIINVVDENNIIGILKKQIKPNRFKPKVVFFCKVTLSCSH
jgi:surfeit locus 1 family protein